MGQYTGCVFTKSCILSTKIFVYGKKINKAKQILHNFFNSAANVNSTQEKKKKNGNVGSPGTFNILVHVALSP